MISNLPSRRRTIRLIDVVGRRLGEGGAGLAGAAVTVFELVFQGHIGLLHARLVVVGLVEIAPELLPFGLLDALADWFQLVLFLNFSNIFIVDCCQEFAFVYIILQGLGHGCDGQGLNTLLVCAQGITRFRRPPLSDLWRLRIMAICVNL